jgi:pyrimidine operon attenuation protein/uracil phosphoribosyltransferase
LPADCRRWGKRFFLPADGAMTGKQILSEPEVRRALARVAHEILERNHGTGRLVLLGIHSRGVHLARRLADKLRELEGVDVPCGAIDITPYRDDFRSRPLQIAGGPSRVPVDLNDKRVVLVDDVLYTGRTVRAAISAILDYGRPESIQLAVLVDRGHRELPIRADYVGKNVPTARDEEVQVRLIERDGVDEVVIIRGSDVQASART